MTGAGELVSKREDCWWDARQQQQLLQAGKTAAHEAAARKAAAREAAARKAAARKAQRGEEDGGQRTRTTDGATTLRQRWVAFSEESRQPKVGHFDVVRTRQEQVLRLEVAVNHADRVHEGQRERDLTNDVCCVCLAVSALVADALEDFAAVRELHDDGRRVGEEKVVHERDNVPMHAEGAQDLELVLRFRRRGRPAADQLDGQPLTIALPSREPHRGKGAFAEDITQLVVCKCRGICLGSCLSSGIHLALAKGRTQSCKHA